MTAVDPVAAEAGRPLAAAGWVVGAILSFTLMAIGGRELAAELNTFEVLAYRSALGLPVVAALLLGFEGWRGAATRRVGLHALRNTVHFAAQNLWFFGVAAIPLAQLVSIEFTNPIWVALLAPMLLGERLTAAKLAGAGLGFLGVLVIARPGAAPIEAGHLAALGAAIGFALTNIMTKRLTREDSALCVLFWMTFSQMAMGFAVAASMGLTVFSAAMWPWVALVGLTGVTAHFCLTRALFLAPASIVGPMEFFRLPVVAAAGMVLYGEPLEWALLLGAGLIFAGNALNILSGRGAASSIGARKKRLPTAR